MIATPTRPLPSARATQVLASVWLMLIATGLAAFPSLAADKEAGDTPERSSNGKGDEASSTAPAEPPFQPPPSGSDTERVRRIIDTLPQASLQEAFRLLRRDYIKREKLDYTELNRSGLQGLLQRLEFGATLLTEEGRESRKSPFGFHSQKLTRDAVYVRFGRFTTEEIAALDETLASFASSSDEIRTLILDLRSPQRAAEFHQAARILGRFLPANQVVFKIKRPDRELPERFVTEDVPLRWEKDLIILVDRETGNVGEILAAELRRSHPSALIAGEQTLGLTVEYRDVPLGNERYLRYAIANVVLPNDHSLFQTGVTPDLPLDPALDEKRRVFALSPPADLRRFLYDRQRPRLNEAALVAGTDPELDYFLARNEGRSTPYDEQPLQDLALQRVLDYLVMRDSMDLGSLFGGLAEESGSAETNSSDEEEE